MIANFNLVAYRSFSLLYEEVLQFDVRFLVIFRFTLNKAIDYFG